MFVNRDIEVEKKEFIRCRRCGNQDFNELDVEYLIISSDYAEEGDLLETENYTISIHGNEKERYSLECNNCKKVNYVLYEYFAPGTSAPDSESETIYTLLSDKTSRLIDEAINRPSDELWQAVENNPLIKRLLKAYANVNDLNNL